jgi:hypothetical protein
MLIPSHNHLIASAVIKAHWLGRNLMFPYTVLMQFR